MAKIPPIEEFRYVLFDIKAIIQEIDYSNSIHKNFYDDVFYHHWVYDDYILRKLYYYYKDNYASIQHSIGKLGQEHEMTKERTNKKSSKQTEESIEEEELDTEIVEKLKPIKHNTKKIKVPEKAKEWEKKLKEQKREEKKPKIQKEKIEKEIEKEEKPELKRTDLKDPQFKRKQHTLKPSKKIRDTSSDLIEKEKPQRNKGHKFQKASKNQNPLLKDARADINYKAATLVYHPQQNRSQIDYKLSLIPSTDKDYRQYSNLELRNYQYRDYYLPPQGTTLYRKDEGKMFVAPPKTWMFDITYFNDNQYKQNEVNVLLGININTRYAVARVIDGKDADTLIHAFEDLLNKELKDQIKTLIFDGEPGISSVKFQNFAKDKFDVKITYSNIHTQTAPIDRLCRTLKHYFMKGYMYEHEDISRLIENPFARNNLELYDKALLVKQMFKGVNNIIAPVPSLYSKSNKKIVEEEDLPKYPNSDIEHEIYDIVYYYNHKQHNGLIRILNKASKTFNIKLPVHYSKITPYFVHNRPDLESLIMKYCTYYNSFIVKKSPKYRIGQRVNVYDTINKTGSLFGNEHNFLLGRWIVTGYNGENYEVTNIDNDSVKYVSKYMIVPLTLK